jgi:hypothetical protein
MLIFGYKALSMLLFAEILNCETASKLRGIPSLLLIGLSTPYIVLFGVLVPLRVPIMLG